jgi:hypothetical protein
MKLLWLLPLVLGIIVGATLVVSMPSDLMPYQPPAANRLIEKHHTLIIEDKDGNETQIEGN